MAIEKAALNAAGNVEPALVAVARQVEVAVEKPGFWRGIGESLGLVKPRQGIAPVADQVKGQLAQAHELMPTFIDKQQWLKHWKYLSDLGTNETGKEKTIWLRHSKGDLAVGKKSANLVMTAHERMAYVFGHWLDLPVNRVQLGHMNFAGSKSSDLISIHHNVGKNPQKAYRVMRELGFTDTKELEFRADPKSSQSELVPGPSNLDMTDKGARYARVRERVANPEIFDRMHFFDRLLENKDRHSSNYMATQAGKKYYVHLIDHGRTLAWHSSLDLAKRMEIFKTYIQSLDREANRLHLGNILPDLLRVARLTDAQLEQELFVGIDEAMVPAATRSNEVSLLKQKRDLIRTWLAQHEAYLRQHFQGF